MLYFFELCLNTTRHRSFDKLQLKNQWCGGRKNTEHLETFISPLRTVIYILSYHSTCILNFRFKLCLISLYILNIFVFLNFWTYLYECFPVSCFLYILLCNMYAHHIFNRMLFAKVIWLAVIMYQVNYNK